MPSFDLRSLCLTGFALLCAIFLHPRASFAQSSSPQEEALRKKLLQRIATPEKLRAEDLRAFYRRPSDEIPVREQATTDRVAAIELGKNLFFDTRLSHDGKMACVTCHNPQKHWVDGLAQSSEGNSRRSMALFNLAWDSCFTWHCEAGSLMSQAVMAMSAPKGMAANVGHAALLMGAPEGYSELLRRAFPKAKTPASPGHLVAAIEYFVSTLVSPIAPFDHWVEGDDSAISDNAKRGFLLFHTKANCGHCHNLWRFSDSRRYDIGLPQTPSDPQLLYKAVGLRNIADRPPYMHTGAFKNLEEVLDFYIRGGDMRRPSVDKHIKPLTLSREERDDIISFLKTLSGGTPKIDDAKKIRELQEQCPHVPLLGLHAGYDLELCAAAIEIMPSAVGAEVNVAGEIIR